MDLTCWCGAAAARLDEVDPWVSNDATGVRTDNGEPLAARCEEHSSGGWLVAKASIGPALGWAWWEPTFAALVDA